MSLIMLACGPILMRRGLVEAIVLVLCAAAFTAAFTYPLIFGLDHLGRTNTDDGRWSLWVVAWVAHALTTSPASLYDANIFYPHDQTLAYSEANLGAGAIGAPVWWLTRNPYTTYNVVVLVSFVLSFAGAYYLVRHLTGKRQAAAVAAVMYAFCPFIFARTAHIQLMMIGGLPFCMLAMHRLVERATVTRSVVLGAVLAGQALSCAYYGIFAGLVVGAGTLWFAATRRLWRTVDYWIGVGLAAFVCVGLTLPFFYPYTIVRREQGFGRTLDEARMYSANLGAWLASSAWAHRWWLPALGDFNEVLFPGVFATILGIAGFWLGVRRTTSVGRSASREIALFYGGVAILGFWASFGPDAGLYTGLYESVPLFAFLRAPARFAIVSILALTVLAAITVAKLVAPLPRRNLVAAALVAAVSAELMTAPLGAFREAQPVPRAYRMLASLPRGPVAEFPWFYRRTDFPRHAGYMLGSTAHWQPLVNGYSDNIPDDFRRNVLGLSTFPSRDAFARLALVGTRYVVFHLDLYDARSRELLLQRIEQYKRYLRALTQDDNVWLYEIVDWPH